MTDGQQRYSDTDPAKEDALKQKFWTEMAKSSFVMLQLDADPDTTAPMTAQLDKDANSAIWFYTNKGNDFTRGGAAHAAYVSKGHDLFARFAGTLVEETDRAVFEAHWNNFVAAWFPDGKESAVMLRMDLGQAAIWDASMGPLSVAEMALGMNVHKDKGDDKVETTL